MEDEWLDDGHRLRVSVDTHGVSLSVICPYDWQDEERACTMTGDDGEFIQDCWVDFNVKEMGLDVVENPNESPAPVDGPLPIKWKQTGEGEDTEVWVSLMTPEDLRGPDGEPT